MQSAASFGVSIRALLSFTNTLIGASLCTCQNPWFSVNKLGASARSSGVRYSEVVNWQQGSRVPETAAEKVIESCDPKHFADCDLVFSALVRLVLGRMR